MTGQASLLGLPPELRQDIFRYVIAPHGYAYLYNTPGTYVRRPYSMANMTLMLVSRSIRAEAKEVLYAQTVFVIEVWLSKRLPYSTTYMVPQYVLERIRHLILVVTLSVSSTPNDNLRTFQHMTSLRDVEIAFRVRNIVPLKDKPDLLARLLLPIQVFIQGVPATARIHIGADDPLVRRIFISNGDIETNAYSERMMKVAQRHITRLTYGQGSLSGLVEDTWTPSCDWEATIPPTLTASEERRPRAASTAFWLCDLAVGIPLHLLIMGTKILSACFWHVVMVTGLLVGSRSQVIVIVAPVIIQGGSWTTAACALVVGRLCVFVYRAYFIR